MQDLYKILDIPRDASEATIKKAYRALAKEWHPDKHQNTDKLEEAEEKFKEISEAYSILSDAEKRQNYDLSGNPESQGPFGFKTTGTPFDMMFSNLFHQQRPQPSGMLRGQTLQLITEISLVDALFGGEYAVEYDVMGICSDCKGSGGTEFTECSVCRGSGMTIHHQHNMIMQTTCRSCGGRGQQKVVACVPCSGQGTIQTHKKLTVAVPQGITHGANLRLAGQGGSGFNGGPPGDLILQVSVKYPDVEALPDADRLRLRELLVVP